MCYLALDILYTLSMPAVGSKLRFFLIIGDDVMVLWALPKLIFEHQLRTACVVGTSFGMSQLKQRILFLRLMNLKMKKTRAHGKFLCIVKSSFS